MTVPTDPPAPGVRRRSSLERLCGLAADLLGAPVARVVGTEDDDLPLATAGALPGTPAASLDVPLLGGAGRRLGTLVVADDRARAWTDDERRTLERLAQSVAAELDETTDAGADAVAWRLATDAAGVGAFEWDLVTGVLRWDDRLLEVFGLQRADLTGGIADFDAAVHPEDLGRVTDALQAAIDACGEYAAEYRIRRPDGQVRWVSARGRALRGEDGRAVRLLGAAYDTTAEQEGEARIARVLESMPTAFFQLDTSWRFGYLNGEAERLLGRSRDQLAGQVIWEAFPAAVGSDFERCYRRAAETGEPVAFDAYYPAPLDAWYEVRAWPNPDGLAIYFVEVTARHEAQEQVARTARRGALLAHVTERLTGTLDLGEAVARLGALVVPDLGDWCVATLVVDPGHEGRPPALRDVGGWHRDPAQQALTSRFADVRLAHLTSTDFLPEIIATEQPVVAADATAGLCAIFEEGEVCDIVRQLAPEHVVVITLRGRDRVVGLLTVLRSAERGPFSADDVDTLAEVAARAGLALDNARLFAEQRDLAEGLQRSLLTAPPQPDHLQIAVRYEAAAETAQVGGDWYDAFLQPEGGTVVVIGDVVGHDTAAAAAMGQVRSLLRGIAVYSGLGPADVLRGVDRSLETLQVDTTATAVVARLEQTPAEKEQGVTRIRWANAGHPPPVLLTPDGGSRVLHSEPDLLLGLHPGGERAEHEVVVERGSTLLLFTDGLIERRGEDVEAGLDRLQQELSRLLAERPPLDQLCDRLLARMVPSRREDDIALVAVRLHHQDRPRPPEAGAPRLPAAVDPTAPGASGRILRARFTAEPVSVPGVRRFVRDAVGARAAALVDDAELCVAELAANAALHGGGPFFDVSVRLDHDAVTITVADEGDVPPEAVLPRMRVADGDDLEEQATTGRGLGIVSVLAAEWGVDRTPTGKRVWARLADDRGERDVRPPDSPPDPGPRPPAVDDELPAGWGRVRIAGVPVALSLRQDEHLDELVRELQLVASNTGDRRSRELAVELADLLRGPAHARHLGRRTAQEAAAAGLETVDIEMALRLESAFDVRRLYDVVLAADRLCREEELLTLCSTEDMRLLRAWMTEQISGQLLGEREPEDWATYLARTTGTEDR